jgi:hypothetical protein
MQLTPKAGFDWRHVSWGKPHSPRSALCSYCSAGISDGSVPLIMWGTDGSAAQFCHACQVKWWGFAATDELQQEEKDE